MTYDELPAVASAIPNLETLTKAPSFAYASRQPGKGTVFLLAGRDTDALVDAVQKLAKFTSMPGDGLIF